MENENKHSLLHENYVQLTIFANYDAYVNNRYARKKATKVMNQTN